jgi:hypothetical protein
MQLRIRRAMWISASQGATIGWIESDDEQAAKISVLSKFERGGPN